MEMAAVTNTLSNITCRWFVLSGFALPNELVIGNSLGTDMLERQASLEGHVKCFQIIQDLESTYSV